MIRLKTVAATETFNAAGFNSPEVTISIDDVAARAVNLYFGATPFGSPDCDSAAAIIQAKGLLDSIGEAAFNSFNFSAGQLPLKITKGTLGGMLLGDRG